MSALLVPWLLLAPLVIVLRRALLATPQSAARRALRAGDDPAAVAASLRLALQFVELSCDGAAAAQAAGERAVARRLLRAARRGGRAFLRAVAGDVARWRRDVACLDGVVAVPPLVRRAGCGPVPRAVVALDRRLGGVLVAGPARLWLRLAGLELALRVLACDPRWWRVPAMAGTWPALGALRGDLGWLADEAAGAHALLVAAARRPQARPVLRFAV